MERILAQPNFGEKISLIEKELRAVKTEILPQLEQSQKTINKVEEYMRYNASFLTDLASSEGRLQAMEGYINSLSRRVEFIEEKKKTSWNRTINVMTIILSLASIAIAVYVALKP